MAVYHELVELQTEARPCFLDVTDRVGEIVSRSGIGNGIAVVFSQHTTCSVIIQEDSHDTTDEGTKYLWRDLLDLLDRTIPRCQREGQYLHPGPHHLQHAVRNLGESPAWSLNTDAHLRSSLFGRSESVPIIDGRVQLGEFGRIYFADFDGVRARRRVVRVQVVGE